MESEVVFLFLFLFFVWFDLVWNDQSPHSSKLLSSLKRLKLFHAISTRDINFSIIYTNIFFKYYLSLRKIRKLIIGNAYISWLVWFEVIRMQDKVDTFTPRIVKYKNIIKRYSIYVLIVSLIYIINRMCDLSFLRNFFTFKKVFIYDYNLLFIPFKKSKLPKFISVNLSLITSIKDKFTS